MCNRTHVRSVVFGLSTIKANLLLFECFTFGQYRNWKLKKEIKTKHKIFIIFLFLNAANENCPSNHWSVIYVEHSCFVLWWFWAFISCIVPGGNDGLRNKKMQESKTKKHEKHRNRLIWMHQIPNLRKLRTQST